MSDLQWSLLALGAVVIAGVLVFNWYQERSHRRRAEEVFDSPPKDILFDLEERGAAPDPGSAGPDLARSTAVDDEPVDVHPTSGESAGGAGQAPGRAAPVVLDEPGSAAIVDFEAILDQDEPFQEGFLVRLGQAVGGLSRTVRLAGLDERTGHWTSLDEGAAGRFRRLRIAMQLVDRQAVASRADLEEFEAAVRGVAESDGVGITMADVDAMDARARELDAFCADVDIAIGLSVVARTGQVFQGTTIRALAESAGLKLHADGQFHHEDAAGNSQFTLDNQDPEPFFPDSIKSLTTSGVTFLLDVPRAEGGVVVFDRMVQATKKFAATLDGNIVDDNRQPLNDHGLDMIRRHLLGVYAAMEEKGIPAGSPAALRLFA